MSVVFDLPTTQGAERLRGAFTTRNFFKTIGVSAAAGRTFAPDDPADVAIVAMNCGKRSSAVLTLWVALRACDRAAWLAC